MHFRNTLIFLFGLSSAFWSLSAKAESFVSAEGSFRSQPQATNLVGTWAYDSLLYGEKDLSRPMYGYTRVGTRFGGSPTLSGFVQVAPVAPLIFEFQKSFTQRFTRPVGFDCDLNRCDGSVQRTDASVRLALGFQNWIFIQSLLWREIEIPVGSRNVYLELENLTAPQGSDKVHFTQTTSLLGYRISPEQLVGVFLDSGDLHDSNSWSRGRFLVFRQRCEDFFFTAGIGKYESSLENLNGTSFIVSVSHLWGSNLSLF